MNKNFVAFDFVSVKNGSYKAVTRIGLDVDIRSIVNGKVTGFIHSKTLPSCRWEMNKWNLDGSKFTGTEHYTDLFMVAC